MIAGGLGLRPSRLFAFCTQLTHPAGFWVRACDGEILPYRSYSPWPGVPGRAAVLPNGGAL